MTTTNTTGTIGEALTTKTGEIIKARETIESTIKNKPSDVAGKMDLQKMTELKAMAENLTQYTIQKDDTLSKLARDYGTTVEAFMAVNPQIKNRDLIIEGAKLTMPAGAHKIEHTAHENTSDTKVASVTAMGDTSSISIAQNNEGTIFKILDKTTVPQKTSHDKVREISVFKDMSLQEMEKSLQEKSEKPLTAVIDSTKLIATTMEEKNILLNLRKYQDELNKDKSTSKSEEEKKNRKNIASKNAGFDRINGVLQFSSLEKARFYVQIGDNNFSIPIAA